MLSAAIGTGAPLAFRIIRSETFRSRLCAERGQGEHLPGAIKEGQMKYEEPGVITGANQAK